jgi:8-oxo-dGTP diphosphatase
MPSNHNQPLTITGYDIAGNSHEMPLEDFRFRPAAYGLLYDQDQDAWLFLEHLSGELEIPGGGIAIGEHPEDALQREFIEETGYQVDVAEPIGIGSHFFVMPDRGKAVQNLSLVYRVTTSTAPQAPQLEPYEQTYIKGPRWITREELATAPFRYFIDRKRMITMITRIWPNKYSS